MDSLDNTDRDSVVMRGYVESLFDDMQQRLTHQKLVVMRCIDNLTGQQAGSKATTQRQQVLQLAIRDAVQVLEETKHSFKSKRLGELREKLERVLAE